MWKCINRAGLFETLQNLVPKLQIGFDPYSVNTIYVFFNENKLEYWEAHLSDASRQYQHLTWWCRTNL